MTSGQWNEEDQKTIRGIVFPTNGHDQLATGRKVRILTVVDTFSRYVPVLDPKFSYRGEDVVPTLDRVCHANGYPKTIRIDQGSEFISRDMDLWAYEHGVTLDFSRPGKPTDNAFIEAFNGRFRAECLNSHWLMSLEDAAEKMELGAETITSIAPTARSGTRSRQRSTKRHTHPARVPNTRAETLTTAEGTLGSTSTLNRTNF